MTSGRDRSVREVVEQATGFLALRGVTLLQHLIQDAASAIGIALGTGIAGVAIMVGSTPAAGFLLAFALMTLIAFLALGTASRLPDRGTVVT